MIVIAPHIDAAAKGEPFETREDVFAFMIKRERDLRAALIRQDRTIARMRRCAEKIIAVSSGAAMPEWRDR